MKLKIGDKFKITKGRHYPKTFESQFWNHQNGFLWLKIGDIKPYTNDSKCKLSQKGVETIKNAQNFLFKKDSFVMATAGSVGKIGWLNENFFASTDIINFDCEDLILKKYLYYFFTKNHKKIFNLKEGSVIPRIKLQKLEKIEINLPDRETLKKIRKIITKLYFLDEYNIKLQKKINLLEKNILSSLDQKKEKKKKIKIGDKFKITKGRHYPKPSESQFWDHQKGFLWLKIGDIKPYINDSKCKLSQKGVETIRNAQNFLFKKDSFVMAVDGSIGKVGWLQQNCFTSTHLINFDCEDLILKKYLYYFFTKNHKKIFNLKEGSVIPSIKLQTLEELEINLPDRETQKKVGKIITKLHLLNDYSIKLQKKINFLEKNILSNYCF